MDQKQTSGSDLQGPPRHSKQAAGGCSQYPACRLLTGSGLAWIGHDHPDKSGGRTELTASPEAWLYSLKMHPWSRNRLQVIVSLVGWLFIFLNLPLQSGQGNHHLCSFWSSLISRPELAPSVLPLSSWGRDRGQSSYRWWPVLPPSLWSRWQPRGAGAAHPHDPDSPLPSLRPRGDELSPGPVPARHPGGWPAPAHHADEEGPGLRVQGGVWGKRPPCRKLPGGRRSLLDAGLATQSMVPGPAASAAPRSMSEIHCLSPHPDLLHQFGVTSSFNRKREWLEPPSYMLKKNQEMSPAFQWFLGGLLAPGRLLPHGHAAVVFSTPPSQYLIWWPPSPLCTSSASLPWTSLTLLPSLSLLPGTCE